MKKQFFIFVFIICCHISATTLVDFSLKKIDGSVFRLSDILGNKIIVIDFWATWCKPCKKLLKRLNQIKKEYKDSVEVVAISVDDSSAFSTVESYIKGRRFDFTVLLDPDSSVSRIYNPILKIPFTIIIDYKGEIIYTHTGYIPGVEKEIEKYIRQITSLKKLE